MICRSISPLVFILVMGFLTCSTVAQEKIDTEAIASWMHDRSVGQVQYTINYAQRLNQNVTQFDNQEFRDITSFSGCEITKESTWIREIRTHNQTVVFHNIKNFERPRMQILLNSVDIEKISYRYDSKVTPTQKMHYITLECAPGVDCISQGAAPRIFTKITKFNFFIENSSLSDRIVAGLKKLAEGCGSKKDPF